MTVSQHHQASRRRSFARRQRQLRERIEHGRRWEPDEPGHMALADGTEIGSESVAHAAPTESSIELRAVG
jgi:hypothetical protein